MTVFSVLSVVAVYLLIGYAWAMLFMHVLTDGRWATESIVNPGTYRYTPMGVGTAIGFTLFWPITALCAVIVITCSMIGALFKKDIWKRLYRL